MDRDGNERPVPTGSSDAGNARWSPDGRHIVFETIAPDVPDQLYVVEADGSHLIRITHDTLFNVFPNWTADGRIVFVRKGSLFVVNPDGTGERLFRPAVSYAVFSRDGHKMVFLGREPGATGGMFSSRVYVADADGKNERVLNLPIDP
jgi:Tol biopolymer transport system component